MKPFKIFAALVFAFAFPLSAAPAQAVVDAPCNTYSWSNEDDSAHRMELPFSLPLGDTTYDTTYVTSNGTLTFGTPDANFSSYPNTPSISVAGYDWVTWAGGNLSYGVNDTGFCIMWDVRPYPWSSGEFTHIKLTVDISRYPSWSGTVESTGWLPTDLRRGIRFTPNTDVVTISEAFTVAGGRPVEMQSCWDGSVIPLTSTCPAEPPAGQCWDGSTVPWNGTCPPVPPDTQCWDGSWVTWSQTCPALPPPVQCWDGSTVAWNGTCPPTPPDITCWDGQVLPWNGTCRQVPPPLECWNGTSVNWDAQCPPLPPDITCWDGSVISWNATCPTEPLPQPTETIVPTPTDTPSPEPLPSDTPTPEPTPEPSDTSTPTPTPEPTPSETVEPTPTPTPTPIPEPLAPVVVVQEPTPSPTPETTTVPTPTPSEPPTTVSELLSQYTPQEAIPFDVLMASGIDYSELPPDQPVTLENGVLLTAEVADALQIFESPSEVLSAVFTDPGKALKAISNVGADLPKEVRKKAQQGTVAVVLVGQVIVGGVTTSIRRK